MKSKYLYLLVSIFILLFLLIAALSGCDFKSDVNERQSETDSNFESIISETGQSINTITGYFYYPFRDASSWSCIFDFGEQRTWSDYGCHSGEDWKPNNVEDKIYSIGKGQIVKAGTVLKDSEAEGYFIVIAHYGNFKISSWEKKYKINSQEKTAFYDNKYVEKLYSVYMHLEKPPTEYLEASRVSRLGRYVQWEAIPPR